MSLVIDEAKVRESLESSVKPAYVVKAVHLTSVEIPQAPLPSSSSIGGTMMFATLPADTKTREDFGLLRRKIEGSGKPLKTVKELDKEIDEMRGRSR